MSISPSPTFACSGPHNLPVLTQAFVRNGCGIIIVHVTWAAQPTGSGYPRRKECAIDLITDMCTYGHRTGMCIYSHKLRATVILAIYSNKLRATRDICDCSQRCLFIEMAS